MSTKTQETPISQAVVAAPKSPLALSARRIDEAAQGAMALFKQAGSFEAELQVAQTMGDMRAMLTADIMAPIMGLMNTSLGFLTDRNPSVTPFDRDNRPMTPYGVEVVRECFIEAKLRGYHTVGNEFNIISSRFYATKNGMRRKVTTFPGVTDFRDSYEVPRYNADQTGAIVKVKATWKKGGTADSLEADIPVRVNKMMGADAILGKCERKLLARVLSRISGEITPDADVSDNDAPIVEVAATVAPSKDEPNFGDAPTAPPTQPKTEKPSPSSAGLKTVQQELEGELKAEGITFSDVVAFAEKTGVIDPAVIKKAGNFAALPDKETNRLLNAKAGLINGIKTTVKKGGGK